MNYLDFLSDAAIHGRLLSIGQGATPEDFVDLFGADFGEHLNSRGGFLRRDYGLFELTFNQTLSGWQCSKIAIQVHRLAAGQDDVVPSVIRGRVDEITRTVEFARLREIIARRGGHIALAAEDDTYLRYTVDGPSHSIYVVGDDRPAHERVFPGIGDVWSVGIDERT